MVLEATRTPFVQRVAVEVLLPEWASHGIVAERFVRDSEAAMRLRSEHAVRVLDHGMLDNGAPYRVYELVEGQTLERLLATWGRLPIATAVDWTLQAAEAVAQAHSYGVAHGGLTPAKLLLTRCDGGEGPCIKVDFGHWTMSDPRAASRGHLRVSPDLDEDVRALGAVLILLLAGKPRAPGAAVERRTVPHALHLAARRSLAVRPEERFSGLAELARAIAPFGTRAAQTSRDRIESLLADRAVDLSHPKPSLEDDLAFPAEPANDTDEDDIDVTGAYPARRFADPASGRVVLMGLAMLMALGSAAFGALYMSVPHGQPASAGAAEMQGTGSPARAFAASPAGATPLAHKAADTR